MTRPLPLLIALCLLPAPVRADTVAVAVAAHFAPTLQALARAFQADTGHMLAATPGSTGKLRAQIVQGAPFAVLLAADVTTPMQLEARGHAVGGTRFTYAVGRLALWSPRPGVVDERASVLFGTTKWRLALANPRLAPYGAAAEAVLRRLKRWDAVQPNLVFGENVGQVFQFVRSGNADLGFVPWSFVRLGEGDSLWLVPADLHPPLRHDAVLLKPGLQQPAARLFLRWLQGPAARAAIQQRGYDVAPP